MFRKKLAPYGHDLVARVDAARRRESFHDIAPCSIDGRCADVIVYCGPDGFGQAGQEVRLHLALPPGDDPQQYLWPVRNHPCAIWWCGEPVDSAAILALGHALIDAGASKVVDLESGGWIYGDIVAIDPPPSPLDPPFG